MAIRLYMEDIGNRIALAGADFHYLARVMRIGVGDSVNIFNSEQGEFLATVAEVSKHSVTLLVGNQVRAPGTGNLPDLGLAFSPIRHTRQDSLIEHATELGVTRITPVLMRHSSNRAFNTDRAQLIVKEAAEQSGRLSLPVVKELEPFDKWLAKFDFKARRLVYLDCRPDANELTANNLPATILLGPEGGFSPEELSALAKTPAEAVTLGSLVLRSETAGLAALAIYNAEVRKW